MAPGAVSVPAHAQACCSKHWGSALGTACSHTTNSLHAFMCYRMHMTSAAVHHLPCPHATAHHASSSTRLSAVAEDVAAPPSSSGTNGEATATSEALEPATALPPFTVVSRTAVAGGVLEVLTWQQDRMIRVWLPPGVCAVWCIAEC